MALVSRLALSDTPALTEPHMKYCHGINPIVLKCFFPCIPFNMGFPLVVISKPVLESAGTFVKKSFEGPTSIDSDSLGKHMYFLVSAPGLGKHFSFLFFLFFFFFALRDQLFPLVLPGPESLLKEWADIISAYSAATSSPWKQGARSAPDGFMFYH